MNDTTRTGDDTPAVAEAPRPDPLPPEPPAAEPPAPDQAAAPEAAASPAARRKFMLHMPVDVRSASMVVLAVLAGLAALASLIPGVSFWGGLGLAAGGLLVLYALASSVFGDGYADIPKHALLIGSGLAFVLGGLGAMLGNAIAPHLPPLIKHRVAAPG